MPYPSGFNDFDLRYKLRIMLYPDAPGSRAIYGGAMKRSGILNGQLAGALARLGHTDLIVVCDVGLPIPPGPEVVDLAFSFGIPQFEPILTGLLDELVIEAATAATEIATQNPECYQFLRSRLASLRYVSHEDLKRMTQQARLVVRTGEATPFANVILQCGVPFSP